MKRLIDTIALNYWASHVHSVIPEDIVKLYNFAKDYKSTSSYLLTRSLKIPGVIVNVTGVVTAVYPKRSTVQTVYSSTTKVNSAISKPMWSATSKKLMNCRTNSLFINNVSTDLITIKYFVLVDRGRSNHINNNLFEFGFAIS